MFYFSIFVILAYSDYIDRYGVSFTDSTLIKLIKTPKLLFDYSIPIETEIIGGGNDVGQQEKSAFFNCRDNIKKLFFQKGSRLKSIEAYGCAYLSVLEEIDLSNCTELLILSNAAFQGCSLVQKIKLPPNLASITQAALSKLSSITRVDFPTSLTSIGGWTNYGNVFSYCTNLSTISWGEKPSIKSLGSGVFDSCNISVFEIPESLTDIITSSIVGNPIVEFRIDPNNKVFKAEGPILYSYDMTKLLYVPITVTGPFTTKEGVTTIGETAFIGSRVSSIYIQPSIQSIIRDAFYESNITEIEIPSTVSSLGDRIFGCCERLERVEFNPTISYLPPKTFIHCVSLKEVIIPPCINTISSYSFMGCVSIEHIYIPNSVTEIQRGVFIGINKSAFIEFPQNSLLKIENDILYSNDGFSILLYVGKNKEIDVVIKPEIKIVELSAFEDINVKSIQFQTNNDLTLSESSFKNTLIESITFPPSIVSIAKSSFENCKLLRNLDFSSASKLTSIGGFAFAGTSLVSVVFPSKLTSLGEASFAIPTLTSVTFLGLIQTIGQRCFVNSSIYSFNVLPSVTLIGSDAFKNSSLKTVTFEGSNSDPKWEISEAAFRDCKNLEIINFGYRIESIGREAFAGCSKLKDIRIEDSIIKICSYAFRDCSQLCNVSIGENSNLNDIQNLAFDQCFSLFGFQVSEKNPNFEVNEQVLYNKGRTAIIVYLPASLETVFIIPNTVQSVQAYAFQRAIHLVQILFEDGGKDIIIGYGAFMECSSLEKVSLLSCVSEIHKMAFYGCVGLGCGSITFDNPKLLPFIQAASPPDGALIPCPTAAFTDADGAPQNSLVLLICPLLCDEDT